MNVDQGHNQVIFIDITVLETVITTDWKTMAVTDIVLFTLQSSNSCLAVLRTLINVLTIYQTVSINSCYSCTQFKVIHTGGIQVSFVLIYPIVLGLGLKEVHI